MILFNLCLPNWFLDDVSFTIKINYRDIGLIMNVRSIEKQDIFSKRVHLYAYYAKNDLE